MGNTCTTDNTVKGGEAYVAMNPLNISPNSSSSVACSQEGGEVNIGGIGRANSEPGSPQAVPIAREVVLLQREGNPTSDSSAFSIPTPNESLGYDFEGPLTPAQPVKSGEIERWLSDSDNDRTPGPASPTEVDRLGSSYEHFEDNAEAFLAEAAEVARREKMELSKKRQKEAEALRRKKNSSSNSFLQSITFALTGKA